MKITLYEKEREAKETEFKKTTYERLLWLINFILNIEYEKEDKETRINALFSGKIINTNMNSFKIMIEED